MNKAVTVQVTVQADIDTVWKYWTDPEHVMRWNQASDDWECPEAHNDLVKGGKFAYTMSAKDKSSSFVFGGTYTKIDPLKVIEYTIEGGRKVSVVFAEVEGGVSITETFETENENSEELQRTGWQAILDSFKWYVEGIVQ